MSFFINPHAIRVGVIRDWPPKPFVNESEQDKLFEEEKKIRNLLNVKFNSEILDNSGLLQRKIKLEGVFGKSTYKKITNKVKKLSR